MLPPAPQKRELVSTMVMPRLKVWLCTTKSSWTSATLTAGRYVAIKYNIQQHEISSLNPTHDPSSLNITALTVIATPALIQQPPPPPLFSPSKCCPSQPTSMLALAVFIAAPLVTSPPIVSPNRLFLENLLPPSPPAPKASCHAHSQQQAILLCINEPAHLVLIYTPLFSPLYHFLSIVDTPAMQHATATSCATPVSL